LHTLHWMICIVSLIHLGNYAQDCQQLLVKVILAHSYNKLCRTIVL